MGQYTDEKQYEIKSLIGKKVKIAFIDKTAMTGVIRYVKKYEIYLETVKRDKIILIFKHAVKYIALAEDEEEGKGE